MNNAINMVNIPSRESIMVKEGLPEAGAIIISSAKDSKELLISLYDLR
jgi:hypothetical protein